MCKWVRDPWQFLCTWLNPGPQISLFQTFFFYYFKRVFLQIVCFFSLSFLPILRLRLLKMSTLTGYIFLWNIWIIHLASVPSQRYTSSYEHSSELLFLRSQSRSTEPVLKGGNMVECWRAEYHFMSHDSQNYLLCHTWSNQIRSSLHEVSVIQDQIHWATISPPVALSSCSSVLIS